MAFNNYKSISTVLKKFQIKYVQSNFMLEVDFPATGAFKEELDLLSLDGVIDNSENAICENLIYPVLKEVWKPYRSKLTLWSHETLVYDEDLSGIPDYTVTQRNPLGTIIFDKPYFLTVEAKQDKFEEGWGQCLAEMIAVQRIKFCNGDFKQILFPSAKVIQDLDKLFAAVNYIFQECELKIEKQ